MLIREYTLTFGKPVSVSIDSFSPYGAWTDKKVDIDDYVTSSAESSWQLNSHNIKFTVEKDATSSSANTATIIVYNMKESVANYLDENQKKNVSVILKAGYKDSGIREILRGTVATVTDVREGTERITTITVSDGGLNFKETTTSRVYPTGTKVDTIISDLMDDIGLPKKSSCIVTYGDALTVTSPYTVSGNIVPNINRLARRTRMAYSVQDGKQHYMAIDGRSANQAAYVSEDTGLIGSPKPINKSGTSQQGDTPNNK